jgi:hypothetical protein
MVGYTSTCSAAGSSFKSLFNSFCNTWSISLSLPPPLPREWVGMKVPNL